MKNNLQTTLIKIKFWKSQKPWSALTYIIWYKVLHPKGDHSWVFIGRTDVEAETPVLWPPDSKSWLIGKDPDAGKDWGQEEKGMTEDELAGWYYRLDGHELGWTPGVGDGQGGLAGCHSWGCKESDVTEWLNWTEMMTIGAYKKKMIRVGLWSEKPRISILIRSMRDR